MGKANKGKMDDAAADRIRKARGKDDGFAQRARIAAEHNKEGEAKKESSSGGTDGNVDQKEGGGGGQSKEQRDGPVWQWGGGGE